MSYPAVIVKIMFDTDRSSSIFASPSSPSDVAASPAGLPAVPLERLEAQICEDCDERWRQHLERTPRHTGPTLIPIQV
jgi:hypothetical protein